MTIATTHSELLLRFRKAAAVEHRLIELERWLTAERVQPGTPEFLRKWTVAILRLMQLRKHNSALEAHFVACCHYLLDVYERQAQS